MATLLLCIKENLLPKETTLKKESVGKLFKKNVKALLAPLILEPSIDPLLSKIKMNSPRQSEIDTSQLVPYRYILYASESYKSLNLGTKDISNV